MFSRIPLFNGATIHRIALRIRAERRSNAGGGWFLKTNEDKNAAGLLPLIAVNTVVWVAWKMSETDNELNLFMKDNFTVSTSGIFRYGKYHTLITSFFSHQNPMQLAFTTMCLCAFTPVVRALGTSSTLLMYFGGGVVSSLGQAVWPCIVPQSWPASYHCDKDSSFGASGPISSVLVWSTLQCFRNPLLDLLLPTTLLGAALLREAYNLYLWQPSLINGAHLSGAAFGALFFMVTRRRL
jgi:membrane associated rhomboid family serine protease